jgi:hypothetical protein
MMLCITLLLRLFFVFIQMGLWSALSDFKHPAKTWQNTDGRKHLTAGKHRPSESFLKSRSKLNFSKPFEWKQDEQPTTITTATPTMACSH